MTDGTYRPTLDELWDAVWARNDIREADSPAFGGDDWVPDQFAIYYTRWNGATGRIGFNELDEGEEDPEYEEGLYVESDFDSGDYYDYFSYDSMSDCRTAEEVVAVLLGPAPTRREVAIESFEARLEKDRENGVDVEDDLDDETRQARLAEDPSYNFDLHYNWDVEGMADEILRDHPDDKAFADDIPEDDWIDLRREHVHEC